MGNKAEHNQGINLLRPREVERFDSSARPNFRATIGAAAFALALLASAPASAACTSPAGNGGDIIYGTNNVMDYCNGTSWVSMGTTSAVGYGTLTTGSFCQATSATQISCTTAAINLASQTTGVLPSANGGTGVNNGSYTITLGGNLTTSGAYGLTLTTTGTTNVTLPTSGTLLSTTGVGTITSGVWNGTAIGVGYGGTGSTSQTTNGVIYYDGTALTSGSGFVYSGGKVGIGTSSPAALLDVEGSAFSPLIIGNNAGSGMGAFFSSGSGGYGVEGYSGSGTGVYGGSTTGYGIVGQTASGYGVGAAASGSGYGISASSNTGVGGVFTSASGYALITGTGNVGIGTTAPGAKLTVNGTAAFMAGTDYTTTGAQSDVAINTAATMRYTGTAAATFYGIVAGTDGQVIHLHNASSYTLTLSNQSASESTAANKIITGSGADLVMAANSSVILQYDLTAARWRVIGGSGSGGTLAGLSDVTLTTPTAGNLLTYDGSKWINSTVASAVSASTAPSFSVNNGSTTQTVTSGVAAKITLGTVVFDTIGGWSTANNRYTPTVAGKYLFTGMVWCNSSTSQCAATLYKNGGSYAMGNTLAVGSSGATSTVSVIVDMNGTTDYVELWGVTVSGTVMGGAAQFHYFSGALLAPLASGSVAGTGTANYVPLWSSSAALTNSVIAQSGSNIGIGTTAPGAKLTVNGTSAFMAGTDYTTTGAQSDVAINTSSTIRYTGTAAATFYGIVAGTDGQVLYLHNASSYTLTLSNQSSSESTAANKIITGTGADLALAANSSILLQYDTAAARWRVIGGSGSAAAGGSATVWSMIASTDITTAATSYTFSGLNGDSDEEYQVVSRIVDGASSAAIYYLRPNGDSAANYGYQYVAGASTTASAVSGTGMSGFYLGYATALASSTTGFATLYAKTGNSQARTLLNSYNETVSGMTNSSGYVLLSQSWNNTSSNITSLTVASTVASGLGVGTHLELWAKRSVGGGSATAAGSTTQVQYNSGGSFAADSGFVYSGGKVGIGSATPAYALDANTGTLAGTTLHINSLGTSVAAGNMSGGLTLNTAATGQMAYYSAADALSGTPNLYVSGSNIGIGTTAPGALLDVNGAGRFSSNGFGSGSVSATLLVGNGSNITNYQGGSLGVVLPTGSGSWLELAENSINGTSFRISKDASTGILINTNSKTLGFKADAFGTAISGAQVVLSTSGNVGIGTTTPLVQLDVNNSGGGGGVRIGYLSPSYGVEIDTTVTGGWARETSYSYNQSKLGSFGGYGSSGTLAYLYINANQGGSATGHNSPSMVILPSGSVGIGTTSPGYTLHVAGTAWVTSGAWSGSDRRWKKDIVPLHDSLSKVLQLQGVNYNWRKDEFPDMKFIDGLQIGLIAQDTEKVLPEIVTTDPKGYKGISYEKLTPVLVEAVKELKTGNDAQIQELKAANDNQAKSIEQLKKLIEQQHQELEAYKKKHP